MDKNALKSLPGRAKRHVAGQERYRFYPLYSILFPALLYVTVKWPLDWGVLEAWASHPWIIVLDRCSWNAAVWMGIAFGAIGLLRNGWIPKLTSSVGLWCSLYWVWWYLPRLVGSTITELAWNAFDYVREWVLYMSGGEPGAEATVWACVFFVIWLVARTPMKIAFRHMVRLQRYALKRWPELSRRLGPVIAKAR